jgi:PPP family 3-phenylpropionic acid transporter
LSRAAAHTAAVYVALFMMTGVHMPFWPLWLADWGLTPEEVALFTALGVAVRVVAGMAVPALADRLDRRRHTLVACALASVALVLAHLGITTRGVLLAATLAVGATLAGMMPIAEALGMAAARAWGFGYARVRGVGSVGFLVANLVGGALIARFGSSIALWWVVACLTALAALSLNHPGARKVQSQAPPSLREIGRLVVQPVFALFVAVVAFVQASHAVMYALGSLHWRALGLSGSEIGALWASSVAVEIVFLLTVGGAAVQRLGPVGALAVAGVGGMIRWGAMMADPTGFWLWPVQGLHALTFAMAHLGAMVFIARAVPERYTAAAQGAASAMGVGGVTALSMALAALLYPRLGGLTYGIGAASSALGGALALTLASRWGGRELAV